MVFMQVSTAYCQKNYKALENTIDSLIKQGDIVGFSACIVKDTCIKWSYVKGWADVENKLPVSENTLFQLASLSKTMTGSALMHLYEKGSFNLDDDVNMYIPFKIRNPRFLEIPITFRMLLTHTSSLNDNWDYIRTLYGPGDQTNLSLGEFLKNCYDPKGINYDTTNFSNYYPGEIWDYCNSNYVLIAYLIEQISKKPFNVYCKENLFKPLEMNETAWFYSEMDTTHIAVNYDRDTAAVGGKSRVYHYAWPGYADGCLHTSIPQFANFVIMLMNNGKFNGKQILKPETISLILSPQNVKGTPFRRKPPIVDMGLTWWILESGSKTFFIHEGGGSGIMTFAVFDPVNKIGTTVFLTGDWHDKNPDSHDKGYNVILLNILLKNIM